MSPKRISIVSAFILCILIVTLFIPSEDTVEFMTMPSLYSFHQTSPADSFRVPVFTTNPSHDIWDKTSLINANLSTDEEAIAIELKSIYVSDTLVQFNDYNWTLLYLELKPLIQTTQKIIEYDAPILELVYPNKKIELPLGSFGYSTVENEDHIALSSLSATHGNIFQLDTVTGVGLSLYNKTPNPIIITSYQIVGASPKFNPFYTKEMQTTSLQDKTVEEIIQSESFDLNGEVYSEWEETILQQHQENSVYIPLSYQSEILAHRFSICVTYELEDNEYIYCIDDFPFIESAAFLESYIPYFKKGRLLYDSD